MKCTRCGSPQLSLGVNKSRPDCWYCDYCGMTMQYPNCNCGDELIEWPFDFTALWCTGCGEMYATQPSLSNQQVKSVHGRCERLSKYDKSFLAACGIAVSTPAQPMKVQA